MKTVVINIYQFHELNKKAKEVAKEEMGLLYEYRWGTEALDSLKEFFKRLDVELIDYDINWDNPKASIVRYKKPTNNISDVTFDYGEDVLTGFWTEYVAMKTWNQTKSIDDAVYDFLMECQWDFEMQREDEYAEEYADVNNYEFLENGSVYNEQR